MQERGFDPYASVIPYSNLDHLKETEGVNAQGLLEKKVETFDYRSLPGQGEEVRHVEVIHQSNPKTNSNTSGDVLASAASAVASTLHSAEDAISGK